MAGLTILEVVASRTYSIQSANTGSPSYASKASATSIRITDKVTGVSHDYATASAFADFDIGGATPTDANNAVELINAIINFPKAGGSALSTPELQAILDRADLEGYTKPSSLVQSEMDTLILAQQASGIWDKEDVFFNFAYNDATLQDFSRIDWKSPTGTLGTLFGGISYGIQGFAGDGVNGKFDTGFTPSTDGVNYTLDDASRFMVLGTLQGSGGGGIDFNSAPGFSNTMQFGNSAVHRINQSSGNLNAAANLINDGFKGINRTSSTNVELFNKSTQISRTATSTSLDAGTQTVLGGFSFTDRIASCYQMGASVVSETPQFIIDYNIYLVNIGLTAYA